MKIYDPFCLMNLYFVDEMLPHVEEMLPQYYPP